MSAATYPPVAVVGMYGRFPNSAGLSEFFENQLEGRHAITTVPPERWDWRSISGEPDEGDERSYSNCGGFISHADCFDARFFGILPREAESMDPQQRLFLQATWSALEDAGCAPSSIAGSKVGVFVGVGNADYPVLMRRDGVAIDSYRATGMALTSIANRVSFLLDLRGPSEAIDTACSSSLVAIHRAVNAIHNGECEMAIAGGINLMLGPELFIAFSQAGMLSRKGRCSTFDADCDGYVRGEGVGAIVLCPLAVAESRGDYIYGVIRGSAENHGGRAHSFTAPNAPAQADVIRTAWKRAGVPMSRASFIETHGTGTPLGDPIEVNGLKAAIAAEPPLPDQTPIYLRALKSHIGHLEAAAGIAAVISAMMALNRGIIPGNLNHAKLNPHIDLSGTPFEVPVAPVELSRGHADASERLAGVSSFGFGGVNAHIVLQSYAMDAEPEVQVSERPRLILLSAKNPAALKARATQLHALLTEPPIGPGREAVLGKLWSALRLQGQSPLDTTPLDTLRLTPAALDRALKLVTEKLGMALRFKHVRDCVTLGEIAEQISALLARQPAVSNDGKPFLSLGVPISAKRARTSSLDEIAATLTEGRDHMRERLALIVEGKQDLISKLSRYVSASADGAEGYFSGAPRSNDVPRPDAGTSLDGLPAWARWFVGARDARPTWQDLYGEPSPRRVPLPGYPFEVTRIWYQAPARVSMRDAPHAPANIIADKAPTNIVARWAAAWEPSQKPPSVSILAISQLCEHLAKSRQGAVTLSDVRFGPPLPSSRDCAITVRQNAHRIQCLREGPAPQVLAEAGFIGMVRPQQLPAISDAAKQLSAGEVRQRLALSGLALSRTFGVPAAIAISTEAVRIPIERGTIAEPRENAFWLRVLTLSTVAWQLLAGKSGAVVFHPYQIASVTFDPHRTGQMSQLDVFWKGAGEARIIGHDGRGAVALAIEGLLLRPAVSTQARAAQ